MIEKRDSISFDFSKVLERKAAATSERQDLIQQFVDAINKTAKKKCTWSQINGQLRYCDTRDLYILFKECSNGRVFGSLFWYKVKKNSWGKKVDNSD